MEIPQFNTKKELYDFLVTNKDMIISQRKAQIKYADAIICPVELVESSIHVDKAKPEDMEMPNPDEMMVKAIINTTNLLDSHMDVHLPGIWNKSLKENRNIMHMQEHGNKFTDVIAMGEDLKASTKTYDWQKLGFDFEGKTEALVFDSKVKKDRNAMMFDQYKKGYVNNHSVGMQYVKIEMAINDKDYKEEFAAWNKYYPEIANKEVADERGLFFAVKEAKVIEGSAVLRGSNYATPTLSVKTSEVKCSNCNTEFDYNSISESGMGYVKCPNCSTNINQEGKVQPGKPTEKKIEPEVISTQKVIDYEFLIKNLKSK